MTKIGFRGYSSLMERWKRITLKKMISIKLANAAQENSWGCKRKKSSSFFNCWHKLKVMVGGPQFRIVHMRTMLPNVAACERKKKNNQEEISAGVGEISNGSRRILSITLIADSNDEKTLAQ